MYILSSFLTILFVIFVVLPLIGKAIRFIAYYSEYSNKYVENMMHGAFILIFIALLILLFVAFGVTYSHIL